MVIHCTVAVSMPNSLISAGNVTFMAVSTTTPENDMMPAATTLMMRRASSTRSNGAAFSRLSCMELQSRLGHAAKPRHAATKRSSRHANAPFAAKEIDPLFWQGVIVELNRFHCTNLKLG